MKSFNISWAMAIGCLALFASAPQAAQLIVDIPSCANYALNGTTITCTPAASGKSCTISGASTAVTGSDVTLTASCSGFTPASTDWTGCAAEVGNTCTMTGTGTGVFTALDTDSTPYTASKLVTFSAPTCSITGTSSGSVGSTLTLSTSCNFTPTTFLWTGCDSAPAAATCTISKTVVASYPITVTASDASNHTASATKSATFNSTSGAMPSTCTIATFPTGSSPVSKTLRTVAANGGNPITSLDTRTFDLDMGGDNVIMARITTPTTGSSMGFSEYLALSTPRAVYASKTPCDMTTATLIKTATSGTILFNIGTTSGVNASSGSINMIPGDNWYIMIINYAVSTNRSSGYYLQPTVSTCSAGKSCGMRLTTH